MESTVVTCALVAAVLIALIVMIVCAMRATRRAQALKAKPVLGPFRRVLAAPKLGVIDTIKYKMWKEARADYKRAFYAASETLNTYFGFPVDSDYVSHTELFDQLLTQRYHAGISLADIGDEEAVLQVINAVNAVSDVQPKGADYTVYVGVPTTFAFDLYSAASPNPKKAAAKKWLLAASGMPRFTPDQDDEVDQYLDSGSYIELAWFVTYPRDWEYWESFARRAGFGFECGHV